MSADGGGAALGAAAGASSSSCAGADGGADGGGSNPYSAAAIAASDRSSTLKCTEIDERGPWRWRGVEHRLLGVELRAHRRVELAARALVRKLREHGAPHRPGAAPFCFAPAAVAASALHASMSRSWNSSNVARSLKRPSGPRRYFTSVRRTSSAERIASEPAAAPQ